MSVAAATLVVLLAIILVLEPRTFQRAIYTLSNNDPRQTGYDLPFILFISIMRNLNWERFKIYKFLDTP